MLNLRLRFLVAWIAGASLSAASVLLVLPPAHAGIPACEDTAWTPIGWRLPAADFNWGFHHNPLTTPPGVNSAVAGNAILAGAGGWNEKRVSAADCDEYLASWTKFSRQADTTATPGVADSWNQVGFQNMNAIAANTNPDCANRMRADVLYALVCTWGSGGYNSGRIFQADVILNSEPQFADRWTTNLATTDSTDLIIQSVATHEFGHVIGLGHLLPNLGTNCNFDNDHFSLTMYRDLCPSNPGRTARWYTLGNGDVRGLVTVPN